MARKSGKKTKSYTELEVYQKLGTFKMQVETFFEIAERKIAKRSQLSHEDAEDMVVALDEYERALDSYNKLVGILAAGDEYEY